MPQSIEKSAPPPLMEIKSPYEQHIVKKEVSSPPLGSPHLGLGEGSDPLAIASINPAAALADSTLLQLKQQQELQQQYLLQQYRQKQQELNEVHEKQMQLHIKQDLLHHHFHQQQQRQHEKQQLQQHIKYLEQQTQRAEEERAEKQRLEEEKIEAIKKKEKHEHSAVASNEVKQRLQDKILKKLRENDQGGSSSIRSWPAGHILPAPEDFPLRKTASEPNICLKVRLKQRMIDRRSSPIVRRKDKVGIPSRRRPITHADSASTPDSGQSSPPNGLPASRSSSGSTPIHEEGGGSPYGPAPGSCSDLNHPFSSLPNISLGRPPHSSQAEGSKLAIVSETEMVSAARAGMPITGHALPSTLPNYPTLTLPVIDSEGGHHPIGLSALRHQQVIAAMETGGCSAVYHVGGINSGPPINEAQVIDLTDRKLEALEGGVRSPYIYLQERPSLQFAPKDIHSLKPPTVYSMILPFAPRSGSHIARPLSRALSSPLVTLTSTVSHQEPISISKQGATTGLAYDSAMQSHMCTCGTNDSHPEHGGRIQAIWNRLQETGLAHRCHALPSPGRASLEDIQSCHSEAHTFFFGTSQISHQNINLRKLGELPIKNFVRLPCAGLGVDSDTTWNEVHTWAAARIAVGCALDLAFKVAAGELRNGYAIVRPPGHHAEYQQAMGFCFFNNVAITARQLINKLNLKKVLIVDWDVHHGNGTQATFYDDPRVLYISLHRYDDGSFFPGTGAPFEVGEEAGFGYNVNVAWSGGLSPPMGDAEYLAAFRSVVIPIAKDFNPDIVLVSAGFDAATQHPPTLGGYKVSPACFAYMTSALSSVGRGKVVLVLEGGYEVDAICDASDACVRALLGDEGTPVISEHEAARRPSRNAIETLQNVIAYQSEHWPVLRRTSSLVCLSHLEAKGREDEQETVSAMASLRVDHHQTSHNTSPEPGTAQGNDDEEPMDQETTD